MRVCIGLALLATIVTSHGDRYHPTLGTTEEGQENVLRNTNTAENSAIYWQNEAEVGIEKRLRRLQNNNVARNIIMFLGDGMSIPTLAAARILAGQRQNRTGEEGLLNFETFPTVGLSKTYCLTSQVPDSACTATAYLCGVKTNQGTLGVTGDVPRGDCAASTDTSRHLDSIAAWALAAGKDAGIVTTTRITHASPSGAYARSADRNYETDADLVNDGHDPTVCPDIAQQLIHTSPGNQFKVILGGGRQEFLPNTVTDEEGSRGRRLDGRNLIQEWQDDKSSRNLSQQYVWNRSQLMSLMSSPPEYLLGLFEGSHIPYHLEADRSLEPTLAELTEIAIRSLNRNENGFFLFVESGRIDHGHHDNTAELALDETIQMDLAVAKAVELLGEEDTLIVVTADHAHVMAFNGYPTRGRDILGTSGNLDSDGVRYMTLSYANGPGSRPHVDGRRVDVTQDSDYRDLFWRTHADAPLYSETHGGDDVGVFANGPYHHMFSGVYEQSQIPYLMAYAACIGPGLHAENCQRDSNNSATSLHQSLIATVILLALMAVIRGLQRLHID